jgi:L-ascorbate metabolism protein UlaG (beta-lactamase superfamily)
MKIKYLAHASFLITSQDNLRIITDPYKTGQGLNYGAINESADIVTVSHGHSDHNNTGAIKGNPVILKEAGSRNINICHLGDLGHSLSKQQLSEIGQVDILMIPVGGFFTIDAKEATSVSHSIGARAIFPLHYKTAKADYPIKPVDEFLKDKNNVRRVNSSEVEFNKDSLPEETEIFVLQPALF